MKALLFINGVPPEKLPSSDDYDVIACTDGAFHYLKDKGFPLEKLDFISGDFDSHDGEDEAVYREKFIFTPDQDETDFHKALQLLADRNVTEVDVFGGSGGEMDHFLGNLTTAAMFRQQLRISFTDDYSTYFFVENHLKLDEVKHKMISLYPFPAANGVVTKGLNWELNNVTLSITEFVSTRNFAVQDQVEITFADGLMVVFVSHADYV